MNSRATIGPWSITDYRVLLEFLLSKGIRAVDLAQFAQGMEGIWLRHDVELDLDSALRMAAVEYGMGVSTSYFVCTESPFIRPRATELKTWSEEIRSMGHEVSLHMVLGSGLGDFGERIERSASLLGVAVPSALTFHAPGLDAEVLAQAPGGEAVYGPLSRQSCQYLSDSTGRWRWGDPWSATFAERSTQLLTHPYWWGGERGQLELLCERSPEHARFLPQFRQIGKAK